MPYLLASNAKPTIALHKASFGSSKGRLAFLGGIAQSLFVKREPLATQALQQAGLTVIGLALGVSESSTSLLRVSFSTISEASQVKPSLVVEVGVVAVVDDELQEGLVGATTIGS